jgi:hypothetical protein
MPTGAVGRKACLLSLPKEFFEALSSEKGRQWRVMQPKKWGQLERRKNPASGSVRLPIGAPVCAHVVHGLVDDALDFIRVRVGVSRPDVLHSALKHAPADGLLDEFREVAFFPWAPRKVRRVRSVSFETLRSSGRLLLSYGTYAVRKISTYTPTRDRIRLSGKSHFLNCLACSDLGRSEPAPGRVKNVRNWNSGRQNSGCVDAATSPYL